MAFQKFTRAEKIDVVKPSDNHKLNEKTAKQKTAKLDDLKQVEGGNPQGCDCIAPCGMC